MAWVWSGLFVLPYLGTLLTRSTTPLDMVERLGAGVTLPTMLTPMIAALIMRILVCKEGVKGYLGLLRSLTAVFMSLDPVGGSRSGRTIPPCLQA